MFERLDNPYILYTPGVIGRSGDDIPRCSGTEDIYGTPLSCGISHMEPANRGCYVAAMTRAERDAYGGGGVAVTMMPVVWRVREGDPLLHKPGYA